MRSHQVVGKVGGVRLNYRGEELERPSHYREVSWEVMTGRNGLFTEHVGINYLADCWILGDIENPTTKDVGLVRVRYWELTCRRDESVVHHRVHKRGANCEYSLIRQTQEEIT